MPCNVVFTETTTLKIDNYHYVVSSLIPHISVCYTIHLYTGETLVKCVSGILEGEQYLEWKTDDYLDNHSRSVVDKLSIIL